MMTRMMGAFAQKKDTREIIKGLIAEHNSLAERAESFSSQPRYQRHGTLYRIWIFIGIPFLCIVVGASLWAKLSHYRIANVQPGNDALVRLIMTICAVALVGAVVYYASEEICSRKKTYLPLSDKKALQNIEKRVTKLSELCHRADMKRAGLQPLILQFEALGSVVRGDIAKFYDIREELIGDEVNFFVSVKFKGQLFSRTYNIGAVSYEWLKEEVARRWVKQHCLDDMEEVLEKFEAVLQKKQ